MLVLATCHCSQLMNLRKRKKKQSPCFPHVHHSHYAGEDSFAEIYANTYNSMTSERAHQVSFDFHYVGFEQQTLNWIPCLYKAFTAPHSLRTAGCDRMHSDFHIQYRTRLMLEICYCHTLSLPVLQILGHAAGSSDRCHRTYFLLLNSKGKPQNFHLGDRIRFCAEKRSVSDFLPAPKCWTIIQPNHLYFLYLPWWTSLRPQSHLHESSPIFAFPNCNFFILNEFFHLVSLGLE